MRYRIAVLSALCALVSLWPCCAGAQKVSVATNLLDYANLGTFNVDAAYALAQHWSIRAGAKYNPFKFDSRSDNARFMQRSATVGARYWLWNTYSGGWVGAEARAQEYNRGDPGNPETTQGVRFGGGLSGGYSKMLSRHWNLDFGVGFWAGYGRYTVFACRSCGRITAEGAKYFILPDEILVSVSYIF